MKKYLASVDFCLQEHMTVKKREIQSPLLFIYKINLYISLNGLSKEKTWKT